MEAAYVSILSFQCITEMEMKSPKCYIWLYSRVLLWMCYHGVWTADTRKWMRLCAFGLRFSVVNGISKRCRRGTSIARDLNICVCLLTVRINDVKGHDVLREADCEESVWGCQKQQKLAKQKHSSLAHGCSQTTLPVSHCWRCYLETCTKMQTCFSGCWRISCYSSKVTSTLILGDACKTLHAKSRQKHKKVWQWCNDEHLTVSDLLRTGLSVKGLGYSPPPPNFLLHLLSKRKVSQLTGSRCVLDTEEVHPVTNVSGLLLLYICALIGFTWPGPAIISTLQSHHHL